MSSSSPTDPAAQAALAAELLDLAKQISLGRYFAGIALTLAVYDWLVVLDREIKVIWRTRMRWTKVLYFINRIASVVGLIITVIETTDQWATPLSVKVSYLHCKVYFWLVGMIEWATFFSGNAIFTLRVMALYNGYPRVTKALYVFLFVTWSLAFAFTANTLYLLSAQTYYSMDFHLCATNASAPLSSAIFVIPAVFELGLFVLTLWRAVQDVRNQISDSIFSPSSPLLVVLYRDGFYYFAAVFAVYTWIAMAYLTQPIKSTYMGVYFGWAVEIVMSCRVYLNLAETLYNQTTVMDPTGGTITAPKVFKSSQPTSYTVPGKPRQTGSHTINNPTDSYQLESKQHRTSETVRPTRANDRVSYASTVDDRKDEYDFSVDAKRIGSDIPLRPV